VTEKRKTRAELEAEIARLALSEASYHEALKAARDQVRAHEMDAKETRKQVDSLKERLAIAEAENQRMRGYIERVQEDDVVREDLVKVGDPDGDHQLVPKRKQAKFYAPSAYAEKATGTMVTDYGASPYDRAKSAPPKHWVTY
jgi:septal ring factor EnvC (AmiA/AmiB activator)